MTAIESKKLKRSCKADKIRAAQNSFPGIQGYNASASSEDVSYESTSGRLKFILSEIGDIRKDPGINRITIYTNDCLRDYYFLQKEGVRFLNEPSYTTDGLVVEFVDHSGNTYVLVEERNYIED